ncbi:hypothetical protein LY16_03446 [Xenorhabdus doucetiae]|uniref:Uncharacterized protein n=1 Tax=Xenorhabdus doucetiae TaxID=351671 RepID=A0ABY3NM85_9GAMM|nr:hypothetical protein LY16_03446 [Xenorhabdus doucetiae]
MTSKNMALIGQELAHSENSQRDILNIDSADISFIKFGSISDLLYKEKQTVNLSFLREFVNQVNNVDEVSQPTNFRSGRSTISHIFLSVATIGISPIVDLSYRIYCRLVGCYSDDALALRWRRLISPCSAVTINCAVLSPSFFNASIASTTSCGALACNFCDLLFMWSLVISEFSCFTWNPVYIEKITNKHLNWNPFNTYTGIHLNVVAFKNNKAQQCCSTSRASNQTVS